MPHEFILTWPPPFSNQQWPFKFFSWLKSLCHEPQKTSVFKEFTWLDLAHSHNLHVLKKLGKLISNLNYICKILLPCNMYRHWRNVPSYHRVGNYTGARITEDHSQKSDYHTPFGIWMTTYCQIFILNFTKAYF